MQRNTLIVAGIAIIAVAVGVYMVSMGQNNLPATSPVTSTQPSAVAVPFTTIVDGMQSGVLKRVNYQIVSPEELSELWKLIKATSTPPTVDFNKEQIIAVFAGTAPHADIAVAKVEDSKVRMFSIAITNEGDSCEKPKSSVASYQIVKVPVTSLPLDHTDIVATTTCPK